jgi:hypothetical protein
MEVLRLIADNQALLDCLKELLLSEFGTPLTDVDGATDEQIGQKVRARLYGKRAVEEAFKKIAKYKTPKDRTEQVNPAR